MLSYLNLLTLKIEVTTCGFMGVQIVRSYMKRRLLRIVPSYYATLVLVYCAFLPLLYSGTTSGFPSEARQAISTLWFNPGDGCPDKLWANWIFANNKIRRAGCMKYAWSQAVQVRACPASNALHGLSAFTTLNLGAELFN